MRYATILLGLALCASARADEITTGDLSFTCSTTCPGIQAGAEQLAPTLGLFSYDDSTGQFLAMSIVWDGIQFSFNGQIFGGSQSEIYQSLLGTGAEWTAKCGGSLLCDQLGFYLGLPSQPIDIGLTSAFPLQPTFNEAASGGLVTATNLDPIFTPEPGVLVLFVTGLIVVWIAMTDRKPTKQQRYEAFCSNQFRK